MRAIIFCILACFIGYVISPRNCSKGCKRNCVNLSAKHIACRCVCPELEEKCSGCLIVNTCQSIDKKCKQYEIIKQKFLAKLEKHGVSENVAKVAAVADDVDVVDE